MESERVSGEGRDDGGIVVSSGSIVESRVVEVQGTRRRR